MTGPCDSSCASFRRLSHDAACCSRGHDQKAMVTRIEEEQQ